MKYAGMPFGMWVLMKKLGLYDLTPALCRLDYTMSEAGGVTNFVRQYTLASGGHYCDCGYKKKGYKKKHKSSATLSGAKTTRPAGSQGRSGWTG